MWTLTVLAALALAAWIAVWLHPARPWDFQPVGEDEPPPPAPAAWPAVAVLVPARNEAASLPHTLPGLLGQRYDGPFSVVLIDDRSDDGTAAVARRLAEERGLGARLSVVEGEDLPAGWVGKMWALEQGARFAFAADASGAAEADGAAGARERTGGTEGGPADEGPASGPADGPPSGSAGGSAGGPATGPAGGSSGPRARPRAAYVLLTDADIVHAEGSLARLVAESEAAGLGLDSRMARLRAVAPWERVLIPAFVFFFNLLYPMRRVNDPARSMAAAAGGCVLLGRAAYEAIGGFPCIKDELIDDVNLGRQVKRRGFPIRLSLSRSDVTSFRGYDTLAAIWAMVRRTAFTELRYSWLRLLGAEAAMAILFIAPVAALAAGLTAAGASLARGACALDGGPALLAGAALGAAALAVMARVYRPATRFYDQPLRFAFGLPLIGLLYMGMTLDSALRHAFGIRSAWKGRQYATRAVPG